MSAKLTENVNNAPMTTHDHSRCYGMSDHDEDFDLFGWYDHVYVPTVNRQEDTDNGSVPPPSGTELPNQPRRKE